MAARPGVGDTVHKEFDPYDAKDGDIIAADIKVGKRLDDGYEIETVFERKRTKKSLLSRICYKIEETWDSVYQNHLSPEDPIDPEDDENEKLETLQGNRYRHRNRVILALLLSLMLLRMMWALVAPQFAQSLCAFREYLMTQLALMLPACKLPPAQEATDHSDLLRQVAIGSTSGAVLVLGLKMVGVQVLAGIGATAGRTGVPAMYRRWTRSGGMPPQEGPVVPTPRLRRAGTYYPDGL